MNYPVWALPASGLLIAAVGIVHVFVSHFAVGGGVFLVLAETKARRERDTALLGFVRALSRFFLLLTLVAGALTGVAIWLTIGLVLPQAVSALVTTFVWAWAIEWTFFAVEIAATIVYWYGWDRLPPRTHLAVGWIYAVSSWGSLVVISGILSFMLTSGSWPATHRFSDGFFNPTFLPTVALRTAIACGLAGLYALAAASFLGDRELRARVARWSATRWIAPAALALALSLVWFLSAAAGANVAIAETLGAPGASVAAVLGAVFSASNVGHPLVRGAARVAIVAALLLVAAALGLAALRPRRFTRLDAALLMLLGLVAMGGGEWVREGLRKPWVIERYMFVNGVRVGTPAAAGRRDPFALEALDRDGVLAAAAWSGAPARFRPGAPEFDSLTGEQRARVEDEAGRAIFRVECAACHTERGHLGIRKLVAGRSVAALEAVLSATAKPVAADGSAGAWSDPAVRVATWRGRRMPPFAGTAAEQHALAVHLARLGGDPRAGLEAPAGEAAGPHAFEEHCGACHGPESEWPIAPRLRGRGAAELYDLIGRLPQVRGEMPPFAGSDEERRALAAYLGGLAAAGGPAPVQAAPVEPAREVAR
jgi:cytochrome bd-type quinol oxidase subunit 1/mono/diheme cytochrome c family protein